MPIRRETDKRRTRATVLLTVPRTPVLTIVCPMRGPLQRTKGWALRPVWQVCGHTHSQQERPTGRGPEGDVLRYGLRGAWISQPSIIENAREAEWREAAWNRILSSGMMLVAECRVRAGSLSSVRAENVQLLGSDTCDRDLGTARKTRPSLAHINSTTRSARKTNVDVDRRRQYVVR